VSTQVVQVKISYFDFAMDCAESRRYAHLPPCLLGCLSNQEHNHEELIAFGNKLANDQKERTQPHLD